jgi:4-hydroxybenzoate polyprenyltransferase
VICWVAGFDLIYATQDFEFDREERLRSLVVRIAIPASLRLAQWLHIAMFAALVAFGIVARLGLVYFLAMPLIAGALVYEHRAASRLNLAGINQAFFQSNAFVSVVFVVAVWVDLAV